MQIQVDIGFDDLVDIVKGLPKDQLLRLKMEIEEKPATTSKEDFETFLLRGPVFTEKQIKNIDETRKACGHSKQKTF